MLLVSWKNGALACDKLFTVGLERFFFLTVGFSLINLIFTIKELIYELEVWHHQRLFRTNGNLNIRTSYTRLKLDYLLVHSGTLGSFESFYPCPNRPDIYSETLCKFSVLFWDRGNQTVYISHLQMTVRMFNCYSH